MWVLKKKILKCHRCIFTILLLSLLEKTKHKNTFEFPLSKNDCIHCRQTPSPSINFINVIAIRITYFRSMIHQRRNLHCSQCNSPGRSSFPHSYAPAYRHAPKFDHPRNFWYRHQYQFFHHKLLKKKIQILKKISESTFHQYVVVDEENKL